MTPRALTACLLLTLAAIGIPQSLLYAQNLLREARSPIPALETPEYDYDRTMPVLATVYWIHPGEHKNLSVVLGAMYNTPGDEGVRVYLASGEYHIGTPVVFRGNDWLVGFPRAHIRADIPLDLYCFWLGEGEGARIQDLDLDFGRRSRSFQEAR